MIGDWRQQQYLLSYPLVPTTQLSLSHTHTLPHLLSHRLETLTTEALAMSFFSKFFGGRKQAYAQPNLRPRSGNSLFNFMILAASCTGGYVLFHSQRRELAALHAQDSDKSGQSGAASSSAKQKPSDAPNS